MVRLMTSVYLTKARKGPLSSTFWEDKSVEAFVYYPVMEKGVSIFPSFFVSCPPSPPCLPSKYSNALIAQNHLLRLLPVHSCWESIMASSSKGEGGGGESSPANSSSSTIYPASFIKRHLVSGADSYRQTLSTLREMDKVSCLE